MKQTLVIVVLLICISNAKAQQQFVFSNYILNQYYYNPALAGSEDVHKASIGYRNQWAGFDEAPVTMHANFYGSYANMRKHGYGVSLMSDRSGLIQNTNI
ncbi:MAG: PorP/SprF family type IX secretion system membrane protein [Crocinitomicaceae bacterium]|nr:PorP/SprF family type IX secretion system membrane protein [Crocinitomicaceae bacterium]